MLSFAAHLLIDGNVVFDCMGENDADEFVVRFTLPGRNAPSRLHVVFGEILRRAGIDWIRPSRHLWEVDLDGARAAFEYFKSGWIRGCVNIEPEITDRTHSGYGKSSEETIIVLRFIREVVQLSQEVRIFLSHKGANKPLVSRFYDVLKELGFDPWLDREDIVAGDTVHRELLSGMKASCAAVLFITPEFRDEKYLAHEVNLAMNELTSRAGRFRIISLALEDDSGDRGNVPPILHTLAYKEPKSELEALRDILRALPIAVGKPTWRR
jgi:hypothetical protein